MKLVVADASALAEYLLRTERGEKVRPVVEAEEYDLHTPSLCDVELTAVLRRGLLTGRLEGGRARTALADYLDLPLVRHAPPRLLSRVLELRDNFSAHDATYVALAEGLGAELLTADRPLARATRRHTGVTVLP